MTGAPALDAWAAARTGLPVPLDRARFDAVRLERLNATVERARRSSPFYRSAGLPPGPIGSFADFGRWPTTRPVDLARGEPSFLAVSQGAVERVVTLSTSGTTGPAKRFAFSAADRGATLAFFAAGMSLFTGSGDRVGIFFSGERPGGVGDGLAEAMRRIGAEPVFIPADEAERAVAVLRGTRPTVLAGPPVAMLAAGRVASTDRGRRIAVRAVLSSSEPMADAVRIGLAAAYGAEVHDHWGMTETGYGGAVDCTPGGGMHLREADLLVEVVDPATGRPLADGAVGEIVVTTLSQEAMPLLRYATGDLGALVPAGEPCACGSILRRLVGPIRRSGGGPGVPGGGVVPSLAAIEERLFPDPRLCDLAATVTIGDRLRLRVEAAVTADDRNEATRAELAARLATMPDLIRQIAAGRVSVDLRLAPGTRIVSSGKRRLRCSPED